MFKIIKELEAWDEITSGNKNNFTIVRNYLANSCNRTMTVGELRELLGEFDKDEEIFVWRGNGNEPYFNYTSNIKISRPYGSTSTNKGVVNHPLILSHDYEKDKKDEKRQRNS